MKEKEDLEEVSEAHQLYLVKPAPPAGYTPQDKERLRLEGKYASFFREAWHLGNRVSFFGNKTVPLLRLYRYKEAFSLELVNHFIKYFHLTSQDYVFDPFAGMGTTLFGSRLQNIPSIGVDKLPIACFVAKTLPQFLFIPEGSLLATYYQLKGQVDQAPLAPVALDVPLMSLAFGPGNLRRLRQWKTAIDQIADPIKDPFLLLFLSILIEASYTSNDGQFLRLKRNKKPAYPDEALLRKTLEAEQDITAIKQLFSNTALPPRHIPEIYLADTKDLRTIPFHKPPTAIITSPPYVNRYDYTRSYCLELCFHFVKNFQELKAIRHSILRSHIESRLLEGEKPPHPAVQEAVDMLKGKDLNNPRIPYMLTAYFIDMGKAIEEWGQVLAKGAQVAVVVDNVRFEGELIPVDLILCEMAETAGFKVNEILVARYKGNSSQQMKKYGRVSVRESVVVWQKR